MPIEIFSSLSLYFEVLTLQIQGIRNWPGSWAHESRIIGVFSYAATAPRRVPTTEP